MVAESFIILTSILFFSIIIVSRIVFETIFFSSEIYFEYYVLLHHYCWFSFVFLWFCMIFKHVAGLSAKRVPLLVLVSPIVFIPIIHSLISGSPLELDYVNVREIGVSGLLKTIFTLNYFHSDNKEQFYELLILLILTATGAYLISKNIKKTFFTTILAYFGSYIISGIHWFGVNVNPRTTALIFVPSSLKNHQAMALIFYAFSLTTLAVLSMPEMKNIIGKMFSEMSIVLVLVTSVIWAVLFPLFFKSPTGQMITAFDVVFTYIPLFATIQFFISWKVTTINQKIIFGWACAVGGLVLVPMIMGLKCRF